MSRGLQDAIGSTLGALVFIAIYAVTVPYFWARRMIA